jgi:hypothetical protein
VFDPEGRLLGSAEVPSNLTIFEIGPDYVLGVEIDELGVQRPVLYGLMRG